MAEAVLVYITAGSREEALEIGRTLVQERLAACTNTLTPTTSTYWWEGVVQQDEEVSLIAKTRADLVGPLTDRVVELHSYDVPCVVALPISDGNPAFLQWIHDQTTDDGPIIA